LLPEDAPDMLLEVAQQSFTGPDGRSLPYLMPDELHYLRVPYGSLDEYERREIQMHAALTLQYLSYIPWRDDYRNIPRYAAAHHEKLNGSGYPEQLVAADIPVQVRIITIADVF